jgi:hypothetical protein
LSDVDATGAKRLELVRLGFDVVDPDVEMDTGLGGLGFGHPLQDHGRVVWFSGSNNA